MKKALTAAALICIVVAVCRGQDSTLWLGALERAGFGNIRLTEEAGGSLRLDAENRRYRYTGTAVDSLLRYTTGLLRPVTLVLREREVPMLRLTVAGGELLSADWRPEVLDRGEGLGRLRRPSFFQWDIPVGVGMRYQLGDFQKPVLVTFDALVGLDLTLWRGVSLQGAMAAPLFNNLDDKDRLRLHHLVGVVDRRLPRGLLLSFAAGFFTENRSGYHLQWRKYFGDERWAVGMDLGYSVYSELTGPERFRSRENRGAPVYTLRVDYRWRRYDVVFELHAGQFLAGDAGVVGRAFRQFDEKRLGVELVWTSLGRNGGFFVRWPLWPSRYTEASRVRVTGAPWFELPYRYVGSNDAGRFYGYGRTLVDGVWEYYPRG